MRLVRWLGGWMMLGAAAQLCAQRPIGSVMTRDAVASNAAGGIVTASAGRAVLTGNATVAARDHTATLTLDRGGEVRVCQTSSLHVTAAPLDALLMALDRGALEIHTQANAGDVVMTPDLRFTLSEAAPLELEMRVSPNGDTCVDNRGRKAPTLKITDAFGEASYELKPGQHVSFEHGSLREVVDRETVPCGCPPDQLQTERSVSLAEAAIQGGAAAGKPVTPQQAAAAHPFPEAVSEGLTPATAPAPQASGVTHVQVATTLAYDPNAPADPNAPNASGSPKTSESAGVNPPPGSSQPASQPPAKQSSGGVFKAVGRFFKRIFVR